MLSIVRSFVRECIRVRPEFAVTALYALKIFNRIKEKRFLGAYRGKTPGGGTGSSEYCYNLWLSHLTKVRTKGLPFHPENIAEFGPGNSIGTGIAALISGCKKYYALDVVPYATTPKNLQIFNELVALFRSGKNVPHEILPQEYLRECLKDKRLEEIKEAIVQINNKSSGISIFYVVPWNDQTIIPESSLDFIYSHSVLEHVSEISDVYAAMYRWLKPGGFMSHRIDFGGHGKSIDWNGYWMYPEYMWKIVGKDYINRQPISRHIREIERNGFEILGKKLDLTTEGIRRRHLASRWTNLSDEDLACSGASLEARKPDINHPL